MADDLTEEDIRELIISQVGENFDYKKGCDCEKCKIYISLQELWGDRPMPVVKREELIKSQFEEEYFKKQRMLTESFNNKLAKKCIKCGVPREYCVFPVPFNGKWAICEYCLQCVGCKKSHKLVRQEKIKWRWSTTYDYICEQCFTICHKCGQSKHDYAESCQNCMAAKLDGNECIICCKDFTIGQVRIRGCSSRPDVHAVCSYICATKFKEYADKKEQNQDKKKGCPACGASVNEKWDIW